MERTSGVLLHISSLPNEYGIGSFGESAYKFVDFLVATGQTYWQILPLTTTGYGDSPYSSYSAFAGNTNFIDLEKLVEEDYLTKKDLEKYQTSKHPGKINYPLVEKQHKFLLEKAVKQFIKNNEQFTKKFKQFIQKNKNWLIPFCEFMTIKENFAEQAWFEWPDKFRFYHKEKIRKYCLEHMEQMYYYAVTQYWFSIQWSKLKAYANQHNILIIGDMPIYIAHDSVEIWAHPELFLTDEENNPTVVSGTPPDAFSADGQFWGNPIYDWNYMEENGYEWWLWRLKASMELYDVIRLDHFRGFEAYWEIPAEALTAKEGHWVKGPGIKFFEKVQKELTSLEIIAEDLGYITKDVIEMLRYTGYPGMKVLQFAFDGNAENEHLPHHYKRNSIAYVGTHDNDTALGWYLDAATQNKRAQMNTYLNRCTDEHVANALNRTIAASVSKIAIYTMQDLLLLGNEARMNTPATIGDNWNWRMKKDAITKDVEEKLLNLTKTYFRMNKKDHTRKRTN